MKGKFVLVIIIVFALLTAVFYFVSIDAPAFRFPVLMGGNILMALLTLLSYAIVTRQMKGRPAAFVRGVSSATYLKLLVCLIAIITYVMLDKANIYKPSIFVLFGIYAVYTIIETWLLTGLAREAK